MRAAEAGARSGWAVATVVACALGMATKEVMVTAPVVVLLFDRTFLAGSFGEAWRRRRGLYLALAATWLPLALLVVHGAGRGGTVGFDLGVGPWDYLLTQCRAIVRYLALALWPSPLVLDYGLAVVRSPAAVWPQGILLLGLLVATVRALMVRPVVGFFCAWFFITLSPSSSFVPLATQPIAEHRMYLPLAALVAGLACALHAWLGRRALLASAVVAVALGVATSQRVDDYASNVSIWADTVAKVPTNARAQYNLANALSEADRAPDAVKHYETALQLEPRYAAAHFNLAGALVQLGREREAITHYEAALRLEPKSADAHANLAAVLIRLGRMPEAVAHYEAAAQHGMLVAEERRRFGRALAEIGKLEPALEQLNAALRLEPRHARTHFLIGMVHAVAGRGLEALRHFTEAMVLDPQDPAARAALADALMEADRPAEAISHYEVALTLAPTSAGTVHASLAQALARLGRVPQAISHFEAALRLNPNDTDARNGLERLREIAIRRGVLRQ